MSLLSARSESSPIAAFTVYLLYQQLTSGKKTQNIPISSLHFFSNPVYLFYILESEKF